MNRFIVILISVWLIYQDLPSIGAEYSVITQGDKKGVIDDVGNIILPVVYEDLGWSDGEFSTVGDVTGFMENGKWGVITMENVRVTSPDYPDLFPVNSDYIVASRVNQYSGKLLFGLLDSKGRAVVGFQYSALSGHGNILLASQNQGNHEKWGVLDFGEQQVLPIEYDEVRIYPSNFVAVDDDKAALFSYDGNMLTDFVYQDMSRIGDFYKVYDDHGRQGLIGHDGQTLVSLSYKSIHLDNDSTVLATEFPEWVLLNSNNQRIKSFSYDHIEPISHGIYRVTANERDGIINIEEEYLVKGNDWRIMVLDENFIIVEAEGVYGVLKEGGVELIPMEYDSIYYSGKHFYALTEKDGEDQWQIYSTYGNLISSNLFQAIHAMTENLIAVQKNDYWGYIDFSGHTIIEFKFDHAWPFQNGRAKVNYLGNEGVINTAGEWVIYPNHSRVTIVSENLFINHTGNGLDVIDNTERIVYQTRYRLEPHSFGLLEIAETNKLGLIDFAGRSVLPPRYDGISELSGNMVYTIEKEGEHGVIDKNGRFILSLTSEYDEIGSLSEGFLKIRKDGKQGFIDLNGKLRIANRYDAVRDFKEGMAAVLLLGKWGFIDKAERLKIQPLYDDVQDFSLGNCIFTKEGLKGLMNMEGYEILSAEYDSLYSNEENSLIIAKSGKFGVATAKGELLIHPKYDLIDENDGGNFIVKKRDKYGVIDKKGINKIPSVYEDIIYDSFSDYYLAKKPSAIKAINIRRLR